MSETHRIHANHPHQHGPGCGHQAIVHDGHVDYLHDGHLHHLHDGHVDEHTLEVTATNPAACTPAHACGAHDTTHVHGPACGHQAVPTATTSTSSWTATCTTRTARTATTTDAWRSPDIARAAG